MILILIERKMLIAHFLNKDVKKKNNTIDKTPIKHLIRSNKYDVFEK